jgi:dTMP kinase
VAERRATYLVFEGIDGAGKSSRLRALSSRLALERPDLAQTITLEPTHGPIGREIRRRASEGPAMAPREELELFLADRRAHVQSLLEPALARPGIILQDRCYLSTLAYQGARKDLGLSIPELAQLNAFAPRPDLVILLDLPVEQALERVGHRGRADAFENHSFLERVQQNFHSLIHDQLDDRWRLFKADDSPESLDRELADWVLSRLPPKPESA